MITRGMLMVMTLFSLFFIAPAVYLLADNQPPYEYDADRSTVVPTKTESGRQLVVHWHLKKINRVCVGTIYRHVVDQETGVRFSYDPTVAARTIELRGNVLDRTFILPPDVTPGKKWYYADAEFACNPLQLLYPLRVRTPRLSFEVLP